MQTILDWLRKIDLTSIGTRIGKIIGAIGEAISSGEATSLLTESFQAAFEQIGNYAMRMFNGLIAVLITRIGQVAAETPKVFGIIAPAVTAALTGAFKNFAAEMISNLGGVAAALGANKMAMGLFASASNMAGSSGKGSDEAAAKLKLGINEMIKETVADAGEGASAFKGAWKDTGSPFGNDATNKLQAHLGALMSRVGTAASGTGKRAGEEDVQFGGGLNHRTEGNVFEKMGFNMGGEAPMNEVAKNTARTVDAIDQLREAILEGWKNGDVVQPGANHEVQ